MLKKLRRKKTAKKVWIALTAAIIVTFVLWGSGGLMRSRQESAFVGKIFGRKISLLEFRTALEATKNQMLIQFGDQSLEILKHINFESEAWDRLILLAEARNRKIKTTDKEVTELIQSYPFFKDRKGKFDNKIYNESLYYDLHTQARVFEEQIRQNLMLAKLFDAVTKDIDLTEEEIKEGYRKENERLSFYYIASVPFDFEKDIAPSEEDLKDYFAENSLEFKRPLSFNLEYVSLSKDEENEKNVQAKIKNLNSRLRKKEPFAGVAKDLGLQVKETGLFAQTEPVPGIGWSPEIYQLVLKLKTGEYSLPVNVDKYYYIFRVKEKKEPYIPDFDSARGKIKEKLIKDKSREMAKQKIEECLQKLKEAYQTNPKSIDFNAFTKKFGLKSDSMLMLKYGSYVEGIGASDKLWNAAWKLKEDELSEIIDMGLSGFYIIKLKSRVPFDENKFQSQKLEFSQKLLAQKKGQYFIKFLGELKRKAQLF